MSHMNINLKLLYFSPTDGTKKIIRSIANAISSDYEEFDITLPQNRIADLTFTNHDLVIIGMPTYAGRIPKLLHPYLDKISACHTLGVFVSTYGNREYEDALLEQYDLFTQKGFIGLGAATFLAEHSYTNQLATNRPDQDDLKISSDFGIAIANRLREIHTVSDLQALSLPGNRPYIVKNVTMPPMAPETNDNCIACGTCANYCPTAAIDFSDYKMADPFKCIKCNSCVKKCPTHAKAITHEAYKNMRNMLITHFATPHKKPELFLA